MPPASRAAIMFVNSGSNVFGCLRMRVGQRRAGLDVGARLQDDRGEIRVFFLRAEDVEALNERQARVDHHRKLTGEHGEVLGLDLLPSLPVLPFAAASAFSLAGVIRVTMICSRRSAADGRVHRLGSALATDGLSRTGSSSVAKVGILICLSKTHQSPKQRLRASSSWRQRPRPARRRARASTETGARHHTDTAIDHVLQFVRSKTKRPSQSRA